MNVNEMIEVAGMVLALAGTAYMVSSVMYYRKQSKILLQMYEQKRIICENLQRDRRFVPVSAEPPAAVLPDNRDFARDLYAAWSEADQHPDWFADLGPIGHALRKVGYRFRRNTNERLIALVQLVPGCEIVHDPGRYSGSPCCIRFKMEGICHE